MADLKTGILREGVIPLGTIDHFLQGDGSQRLVPLPSADPRDPLVMPLWRKWISVAALCLFCAIGLSAQLTIASAIPVFVLEYNGLDPKLLSGGMTGPIAEPPRGPHGHRNLQLNQAYDSLPVSISAQRISLLASLPNLFLGISNFLTIPLAEVFGRRLIVLIVAALSFTTLPWCATSTSFKSHLSARCLQALGTGAVEALVPVVLYDFTFVHERNTYMAILWGTVGVIGTVIGVSASHIISNLSWRWLYWILTIPGAIAFLMLLIFLPETKWKRSLQALQGCESDENNHVEELPEQARSRAWNYSVVHFWGFKDGIKSVRAMLWTLTFPNIIWVILLNAVFIGTNCAATMTAGAIIILPPYSIPLKNTGLLVLSLGIGTLLYFLISGLGSDWISMRLTERNHGMREPEHQLINLLPPVIARITGMVLFGFIGDHPERFHWTWLFLANSLICYGYIAVNSILSVYAMECYPQMVGSLLVVLTSPANILSFGMSFGVFSFLDLQGFVKVFGIFATLIGFVSIFGIPVWCFGRRIRAWTTRVITMKGLVE